MPELLKESEAAPSLFHRLFSALLFAWAAAQCISFFLFRHSVDAISRNAVPAFFLLPLIIAFAVFWLAAFLAEKRLPSFSAARCALPLFLLRWGMAAYWQASFPISAGVVLLSALLLSAFPPRLRGQGPLYRRIPDWSAVIFFMLTVINALLLGFEQSKLAVLKGANRVNPDEELLQKYLFLTETESWILLLLLTAAAIFVTICIAARYAEAEKIIGLNRKSRARIEILLAILAVSVVCGYHFYFLCRLLIYRVRGLSTPSFDFGLFHQMFHYLRRTGLPLTTLERDGLYSHLQVHFSPILYLLLPVFSLFPYAETLQVSSVFVVILSAFPLFYLLAKYRRRPLFIGAAAAFLLLQPGLIQSAYYDMHENCFLPLLISLLFLALYCRKILLILLASLALLAVKEDAALYVFSAGLFWTLYHLENKEDPLRGALSKRERSDAVVSGIALIFLALGTFFVSTHFLEQAGDGAMFYRYNSLFQNEGSSLFLLLRDMVLNPVYYLEVIFRPQKLRYLFVLLFSCGFLPLFHRKKSYLVLLLPLIAMNLISDYSYQYNLSFHYNYGSHSFVAFSAILALAEIYRKEPAESSPHAIVPPGNKKRLQTLGSAFLCLGLTASLVFNIRFFQKNEIYIKLYEDNAGRCESMKETLEKIPRDKSVACGTFLSTYLADVEELYDYEFNDSIAYGRPVDLLILDLRNQSDWTEAVTHWYQENGYVYSKDLSSPWIAVLERRD